MCTAGVGEGEGERERDMIIRIFLKSETTPGGQHLLLHSLRSCTIRKIMTQREKLI
jgi:hypothetical protein